MFNNKIIINYFISLASITQTFASKWSFSRSPVGSANVTAPYIRRLAMAIPCSQWWYLHMTSVDFIAIFQRKFMIICVRVGGGNNGTPFVSCSFHTISIAQFTGPVAIIMTATFLSHPIRAIALVNRFYYLNTNNNDKNAFSYSFKRFEHVKMTTANLERCFVVISIFPSYILWTVWAVKMWPLIEHYRAISVYPCPTK